MKGNARIKSTMLGYEDHGILTCFLMLEQKGSVQGFGGYSLGHIKMKGTMGTFWLERILKTVGVQKWEDLPGMHVRVDGEDFGIISGIGHITEDDWFYPKKELELLEK